MEQSACSFYWRKTSKTIFSTEDWKFPIVWHVAHIKHPLKKHYELKHYCRIYISWQYIYIYIYINEIGRINNLISYFIDIELLLK